jgi:hypothetical protein
VTAGPGSERGPGPEPGPALDLVDHPFTRPGSRLLVLASPDGDGVRLATAEYERPADRCRVLRGMRIVEHGSAKPLRTAEPALVTFAGGETLAFADDERLSLSIPAGGAEVVLDLVGAPATWSTGGQAATDLPGRVVRWAVEGEAVDQRVLAADEPQVAMRIRPSAAGARLVLAVGDASRPPDPLAGVAPHPEIVEREQAAWRAWFASRPSVRPDLVAAADLAWWVLGANQVRLAGHPGRLLVAPSKLGYVAAWQWDSYFIAAGLRHGRPDLAWDQVAFFLERQAADGQMPDVVSDAGTIASVRDLPPEELRPEDRAAPDTPITKPPLAGWAAWEVHRVLDDPDRLAWALPRIAAAQRWWDARSDVDGDGLAEYGHRFSSGLDDSPLFDGEVPVESPDLNAYLAVQDDRLGRMAGRLGMPEVAAAHRAAADVRCRRMVARRWDPARGRFRALAGGREIDVLTPFHLMPLLTGRLPTGVAAALADTIRDPRRFWTAWPVPTVAADDPAFDPDHMWRGPVWLNVNRLLVEGLRASGHGALAFELAERTLEMVVRGGGMHEHWNPLTGARPSTATSCFSWSAALFIDVAVSMSAGADADASASARTAGTLGGSRRTGRT